MRLRQWLCRAVPRWSLCGVLSLLSWQRGSAHKATPADASIMAAEDGERADYRTLFVTGLAYSCTREALEQACSDYGPVRSCFLVKPAGAEHHKVRSDQVAGMQLLACWALLCVVLQGCGYVQYALQADMQAALEGLSGRELAGRAITVRPTPAASVFCPLHTQSLLMCIRLQVQRARKRASFEERRQKRTSAQADVQPPKPAKKAKRESVAGLTKPQLIRTVALGGFAAQQAQGLRAAASSVGEVGRAVQTSAAALSPCKADMLMLTGGGRQGARQH